MSGFAKACQLYLVFGFFSSSFFIAALRWKKCNSGRFDRGPRWKGHFHEQRRFAERICEGRWKVSDSMRSFTVWNCVARPPTSPLVRLPSSAADITVKLRNRGPDAYKIEVYGDSITVEQRLSCDGCRTCKLKSKSGVCHQLQAPDERSSRLPPRLYTFSFPRS